MKLHLKFKNIWKKYNWIFIYKKNLQNIGRLDYFLGNLLAVIVTFIAIIVGVFLPKPLMIILLLTTALGQL